MPWENTKVEDVRYNFICSVKSNQGSFTEVCAAFGISRKTGYKWMQRYQAEGKAGRPPHRFLPGQEGFQHPSTVTSHRQQHPAEQAPRFRAGQRTGCVYPGKGTAYRLYGIPTADP